VCSRQRPSWSASAALRRGGPPAGRRTCRQAPTAHLVGGSLGRRAGAAKQGSGSTTRGSRGDAQAEAPSPRHNIVWNSPLVYPNFSAGEASNPSRKSLVTPGKPLIYYTGPPPWRLPRPGAWCDRCSRSPGSFPPRKQAPGGSSPPLRDQDESPRERLRSL